MTVEGDVSTKNAEQVVVQKKMGWLRTFKK